jgi:ABC-type dipeptide/oligopeptide/nickel transport system permease subunit
MIVISPFGALPASSKANGTDADSRWSIGKLILSAIVVLMGIGVGSIIGVFIGLATGWIDIPIC